MNIANNLIEEIHEGDIVEIQYIDPGNCPENMDIGKICVAHLDDIKNTIHCEEKYLQFCNKINKKHCILFKNIKNENEQVYSCYCEVKLLKQRKKDNE